ncbi:MAG: RNA polymerase sigma-70 factor (ECF subfamily), partial [Planctomycetota bacterium]
MAPSNTTPHIEDLLKHADWVRGLARRLVNDDAQAEDLVQDTWLTAIERPPAHAGNIRAWLGRVVTNLAASRGRSNRRRNFREEQAARPEAEEFGADLAREAGLTAELVEQVLQLPEPYRAVLLLRYFRGRKPTQIARELDRSLSTVKTQLQRGIERLRASFDERYGDREKWCSALAPLLRWGAPATGALGSLLPLAAVLTILAGIVASQWWMPAVQHSALLVDESSESQHEAALPGIELEDVQAVDADDERIAAEANQTQTAESKSQDVVEPVSTLELFKLHGRLLTVEGKPVAGARLEWIDPSNLRWSDDRQQRIVGEDIWMPIAAELRETLREDAEQRSQFAVRNFRRHDLAVALLADEALPTYQSTTSFDGRFVLAVPGHGKYLRLLDESMGIIGRSS